MKIDKKFLRPSSSERWLKCYGSLELMTQYAHLLPERDNLAAERGRKLHAIASDYLSTLDEVHLKFDDLECDMVSCESVYQYVNYIKPFICNNTKIYQVFLEKTLNTELLSGTSDAVILHKNMIEVVDFKTGKISISPENNTQLICYAYLAFDNFKPNLVPFYTDYDIEYIKLTIVQYLNKGVVSITLTIKEAKVLFDELESALYEILNDSSHEFNRGDHCTYCEVKAFCPKIKQEHADLITTKDTINLENKDLSSDDVKQLFQILDNKKSIIDYLQQIEDLLIHHMKNGNIKDNNHQLTTRYGQEKWVDDAKICEYVFAEMMKKGVTVSEITDIMINKTIKSPSQLRKSLDKTLSFPAEFSHRLSIGHKLIKEKAMFSKNDSNF